MIQELVPAGLPSLEHNFEKLAQKYPLQEFDEALIGFLQGVHNFNLPLLSQLESGVMDDFSAEEVADLRARLSI